MTKPSRSIRSLTAPMLARGGALLHHDDGPIVRGRLPIGVRILACALWFYGLVHLNDAIDLGTGPSGMMTAMVGQATETVRAETTVGRPTDRPSYRPDLDGLRAIAVGLV